MINRDEMLDVTDKMIECGGRFVESLALTMRLADDTNLQKLIDAFPEYWKKYKELIK